VRGEAAFAGAGFAAALQLGLARVRTLKPESLGIALHGADAEGDVIVERDAEFGCAFDDVVAIDAASEGFVFHFLFHACDFDVVDGFGGLDQRAGSEKAGELVAGEQRFGQMRDARDAGVFGVAEDGNANFLRPALLGKYRDADKRVLFA